MRPTLSLQQSQNIQRRLAPFVRRSGSLDDPQEVTGVATAGWDNKLMAVAVRLSFPTLMQLEYADAEETTGEPYQPGLRAFREGEVILRAIKGLSRLPGVLFIAGHGLAHPQRFGLACHIGLWLDVPTIGCSRRLMCGEITGVTDPASSSQLIIDRGEVIGAVLERANDAGELFISIGHRISLSRAVILTKACRHGFTWPEPLWLARQLVHLGMRTA